jgi:membrane protease YdiL (CAAX protease family)
VSRSAIWRCLAAFGVAIVLIYVASTALVFGVALARARRLAEVPEEAIRFGLSVPGITAAAFLSACVMAAVALVSGRLETRDLGGRLRLLPSRARSIGVIAAMLGMTGLSLICGGIAHLLGLSGRGTMGAIARALEAPTPAQLAMAVATIAIAPGVAEEVFFRGLIQTKLASIWRRWPAIVVTAVGFGLIHLDFVQGSIAFLAGIYLGWIVERFGSIRPAIAAHAFNNAAFVVLASFGSADADTRTGSISAVAIGTALWIGSMVLLRSRVALRNGA